MRDQALADRIMTIQRMWQRPQRNATNERNQFNPWVCYQSTHFYTRFHSIALIHHSSFVCRLFSHEVLIHVCDEVKGSSKDFSCPQRLLVSKMGYFADVTAGQRLEDMDISVHCDLQIFEWLMRWVKKDALTEEMWPLLDSTNVVPILVSAGFLQVIPFKLLRFLFYMKHIFHHTSLSDGTSSVGLFSLLPCKFE